MHLQDQTGIFFNTSKMIYYRLKLSYLIDSYKFVFNWVVTGKSKHESAECDNHFSVKEMMHAMCVRYRLLTAIK